MRVLATFVGGWGHAEPLLPMTSLARRRGHDVTFAGQQAAVARLAGLGYRTVGIGPDTLSTERRPLVPIDRAHERRVAAEHFVAEFGALRSELLAPLVAADDVGLVVCDEMDAGGVIAAERAGVACVTVSVLAAGRLAAPAVIGSAWSRLRVDRGLAADPTAARFGATMRLRPAPASFADPQVPTAFPSLPVRPAILDPAPAPASAGPVRVYATLGTVFDVECGDLFHRLLDGLAAVATPSLLTIGDNVERHELPSPPAHVQIESFLPQREVLPGAAAVVCHGGTGTLIAALSCGAPVVLLPMGADQPDNADRCAELGVGLVLDAMTATAADIAAAVGEVVGDHRYRTAAHGLAREAGAQPRLADVDAIVDLLSD